MAPAVPLLLMAAGTMVSAIATRNKLKFQSKLARQNADQQRAEGALEAQRHERETGRRIGAIAATVGASGATFSGTPLSVLADEATEAEENRLLILAGAESAARRSNAQADALSRQATAELVSGAFETGSTLLTASAKLKRADSDMTAPGGPK